MTKSPVALPLLLAAALVTCLVARSADTAPASALDPAQPVPILDNGKGAFATGKYPSLFAEIGHSESEIKAKVQKAYNQLFHGDPQTQALYIPAGTNTNGPLAYIPDVQHTDVRSEGMSYGMMIAVQMDKKAEFDALWNWSMTYMYHADPKHPSYGYFSWQMNYDGTAISEGAAPDGEEYFAMALLFAANRWGNGKGIYDYKAQADTLLHNMVHREIITGPTTSAGRKIPSPRIPADPYQMGTIIVKMPDPAAAPAADPTNAPARGRRGGFGGGFGGPRNATTGKEVSEEHKMILFVPDSGRGALTDPSYHLPAFYELWGRWGPTEDREFWLKAAQVSRDLFVKAANPQTGLIPNMANFDGTPRSNFQEDAWRCAMNWTVDWNWFRKDPRQQELSDRLQKFFESKGMDTYGDHWSLDGNPARNRHSPGLVATTGLASMAATDKDRARKFAEALWNLDVPSSLVFRYYDGLLYMMCMLHASGEFQAIMPRNP